MAKRTLDPQERLGQIITAIIAAIHLLLPAIRLILDFGLGSLLTFLISAILSVALFSGIDWVRYLFITGGSNKSELFILILISINDSA